MRTAKLDRKPETAATENYLGFVITIGPIGFTAVPDGWKGATLFADSLPLIRQRIWFWWHRVA